jgi:hypothetical protein
MTQEDWDYLARKMYDADDPIYHAYALRLMSPWRSFGIVWEWASSKEWWNRFLMWSGFYPQDGHEDDEWLQDTINPTRFPKLITDFLREREK